MIKIWLSPKGGIPTAVWASLAALALGVFVYALFAPPLWTAAIYLVIIPILFVYFPVRAYKRGLTVSSTEIRVRQRGVIKTTRRLGLGSITGTTVVASPLQRALGVCCLVLHAPGMAVWVLGITREDAARVVDAVEAGV